MFWELYQWKEIDNAQRQAGRAELKSEQVHHQIALLEDKIESLALACQSLWELLRDNTDLTEVELNAKIQEVDLRDGRQDGKLSRVVGDCPSCGRKTSKRRHRCIYCGSDTSSGEVFGVR